MPAPMPRSVMHSRTPDKGAARTACLHPGTNVNGERFRRFQGLHYGAEVNRLGIVRFVFRDLGPVQHFESVTLEHLFAAAILKGRDLPVNVLLAGPVEVTQI